MARTPNCVLTLVAMKSDNRPVSEKTITRAFLASGYSVKRAKQWIRDFRNAEILEDAGEDENGFQMYNIDIWSVLE